MSSAPSLGVRRLDGFVSPVRPRFANAPRSGATRRDRSSLTASALVHAARTAAASKQRYAGIDAARFLAAAGVVYLHSIQSSAGARFAEFGQLGVPLYLFVALLLQARSFRADPDRSPRAYTLRRTVRLYVPFLFWCAVYFIGRTAKHVLLGGDGAVQLSASTLWSGTQYHLWFLPFLLAVSTISAGIHARIARATADSKLPHMIACASALLGVAFCANNVPTTWIADFRDPTYALMQMWRAMPSACWALSFSIVATANVSSGRRGRRTVRPAHFPWWFAVSALLALVGVMTMETTFAGFSASMRGLCGMLCTIVVLAPWRGRAVETLAQLGRYSFAIYLSHVLVVEILHAGLHALHRQPSLQSDLLVFGISLTSATAFGIAVAGHPKLAWIGAGRS